MIILCAIYKEAPATMPKGFFCMQHKKRLSFNCSRYWSDINRVDAHFLAITTPTFKFHNAVNFRKQSIVFTDTHVRAWMNFRSALTNQDAAASHCLTVCTFHAKTFRFTVATVLCGTYTFFDANN